MDRKQCEIEILRKLLEIEQIYHSYQPKGANLRLFMGINDDGELNVSVENNYMGEDKDKRIDAALYIGLDGDRTGWEDNIMPISLLGGEWHVYRRPE